MKPRYELAQVIDRFGEDFQHKHSPNVYVKRTLSALQRCRTSSLGGHVDKCDECGHIRISYNSCRNRHCPKCQNTQREAWVENRKQDLLPIPYFHMVFTVPDTLRVFRGKFISALQKKLPQTKKFINDLYKTDWVVYSKEPFAGPEQVIEYLGRYTHKVAIGNHRLLNVDETGVRFSWRDYRDNKEKVMPLKGAEFLRRFCVHILPKRFVRIRHYGLLSTSRREDLRELQQAFGINIPEIREKKHWKEVCREHLNYDPDICPQCGKGHMSTIEMFLGHDHHHCLWLHQLEFFVKS